MTHARRDAKSDLLRNGQKSWLSNMVCEYYLWRYDVTWQKQKNKKNTAKEGLPFPCCKFFNGTATRLVQCKQTSVTSTSRGGDCICKVWNDWVVCVLCSRGSCTSSQSRTHAQCRHWKYATKQKRKSKKRGGEAQHMNMTWSLRSSTWENAKNDCHFGTLVSVDSDAYLLEAW